MEESKVPDPSMVDASDSGRNNLHGETSCDDVTQAVTQFQHGDDDDQGRQQAGTVVLSSG